MTTVLGQSAAHHRLLQLAASAASTDAEVLILGPSGVGKELYARLIHESSPRAPGAFVPVNCGALPPELFENELFGHAHGAYTGAATRSQGLVHEAHRGTLFLDEVDALHVANQVKLLRLIQQKEYRPLGEARLRKVDIRIIAATNAELLPAVQEGRFRSDLFFRLRVLPLEVPPLKDRREDIPLLLEHFLERYSAEYGKQKVRFSARAHARLLSYEWPGNVRELENCVRFLLCTYPGAEVDADCLPLLQGFSQEPESAQVSQERFQAAKKKVVNTFERSYLEEMLDAHGGNIAAAARASGKHRRAFYELMRRHGLHQR